MDIKKIGAVLATIIISLIRVPMSVLAWVFITVDKTMIKWNVRLAKHISKKWCDELYWGQEPNIHMAKYFVNYFENLQDELA